jgi:hypothetical protein
MRISPVSLLCLSVVLVACKSADASNPLIGTWVTADNPIPAGCMSKFVFADKTMYFEDPGVAGGTPPSKGTVRVLYSGDPKNPKHSVVMNPSTSVMDDWDLSDPTHAISGRFAQCHYVKK